VTRDRGRAGERLTAANWLHPIVEGGASEGCVRRRTASRGNLRERGAGRLELRPRQRLDTVTAFDKFEPNGSTVHSSHDATEACTAGGAQFGALPGDITIAVDDMLGLLPP
jgi:hypothetical protein